MTIISALLLRLYMIHLVTDYVVSDKITPNSEINEYSLLPCIQQLFYITIIS